MLRQRTTFVSFFRAVFDAAIVACVWLLSYHIRYNLGIFSATKGISDFKRHLVLAFPVVLICLLYFRYFAILGHSLINWGIITSDQVSVNRSAPHRSISRFVSLWSVQ